MMQLIPSTDQPALVALLRDADEDVARVQALVAHPAHRAYLLLEDACTVGAVLMQWDALISEILYIAVAPDLRGQGVGRRAMQAILAEARQRTRAVLVGTANASLDQIAFYQKCGFRMDHVRRDYFDYLSVPAYEHGIRIRDMLVLRIDFDEQGVTPSL